MRKILSFCLVLFSLCFACPTGAVPPDWLARELENPAKMETPGVYLLSQNRLLAVGAGRVTGQLREDLALRLAGVLAENDAKSHLARHLFADTLQREAPRRFSVNIAGAVRVYQKNQDGKMIVGLLFDAHSVKLVPLSPLADCYDVRVATLVERLLDERPMLAEGGGEIFPQEQGWVAMGVGFAALPVAPDANAEREARVVASVNARKALSEAVFGISISTSERYQEIVVQGPGGAILREWAKSITQETVQGFFQGAEQAGEWKTDDDHLVVAVLVSRPPIRLEGEQSVKLDKLPHFGMEEEWQEAFLQRPWMLGGGATLYAHKGIPYLLVLESAPLEGDPVADSMRTPLLIDVKARTTAV